MKQQPNILLLFMDQLRFDAICTAGNPHMQTPNIDRLVKEGALFTNAYTPNPVCVPARHNLLTGLTAKHHGFFNNGGNPLDYKIPTMPRLLADHGYETRAIGKMHFKPARRHHGFDKMELMEELPDTREEDEYAMYLKKQGYGQVQNIHGVRNLLYMTPQHSLVPDEHHGSNWVGDRSVDFIKNNNGRHPFFLWSSWIAPHPPFDIPESYKNLYRDSNIPTPIENDTPLSARAKYQRFYMDFPNKDYITEMRRYYYSAVTLIDENVGKIIDSLEAIGQLDNTMIILAADHGEMLGDHGLGQKMLPYDSCAKIPFIVRYPKHFKAGTKITDFVDLNDILPTFLDLSGTEYPGDYELPGESLLKISHQGTKDRTLQYMEHNSEQLRWISMRDKTHKYNYYYAEGYEELFNLEADPEEKINLLYSHGDDKAVVAKKHCLKTKLLEYERKWAPEKYTADGDFIKYGKANWVNPIINKQFHIFPNKITDETERKTINGVGKETRDAVAGVKDVDLKAMHIKEWKQAVLDQGIELDIDLTRRC
ncbi:MAG: sulfatase-like hydrolase/transferase [Victivallaceae bacterium]|nr:sulfatase-like hydrolase/transferase [Victivallaceae bacterium]